MLLQLSHFFPICPPPLGTLLPSNIPLHLVHSMGHECKFFGFSISYTILGIPLSIMYLPIMLLNPCTFPPFFPSPHPADNPPNYLHTYDSVPVLVVCLVCFCFLDSVVDSCVCHFTVHTFDLLFLK